ncbi:unnamed protein product [Darwinula stevensoni]|nr:unnamed protein product [Darwinula stevensoni]CAG0883482.1 unnamed protein product [Darwinula stevensoni]
MVRTHERENMPRRAAVRNARARLRRAELRQAADGDDDDNAGWGMRGSGDESDGEVQDASDHIEMPEGKMGAKKRKKMEMKAEKKAAREAMEQEREERREREEKAKKERELKEEREAAEEKKKEEEERKRKEEQEKREQEEYEQMKAAFSVEEEGFEENTSPNEESLLARFLEYIRASKVVLLEDLAAQFRLKVQDVISRIHDLQNEGSLTGVIDDRGKFIYVSREELEAVAKFIRQRGRVSIAELAECSNALINLKPDNEALVSVGMS